MNQQSVTLMFGESIEMMSTIPDNSVDLVLTDLPYGTTSCIWDVVIPFDDLWREYGRVCKMGAPIITTSAQPFTSFLITSKIDWFKYNLVWKKSKCGSPLLAKYRPMNKHEDIVVFSKGGGKTPYFPIMEEGTPYSRKGDYVSTNNHGFGVKTNDRVNSGFRYPSSILDFPQKWRRQDQVHPTQKPVDLFEYLVKTYSSENDVVLDNVMGSGTTGVACVKNNRKFIGIEKDAEYFNIASRRIEDAAVLDNVLEFA